MFDLVRGPVRECVVFTSGGWYICRCMYVFVYNLLNPRNSVWNSAWYSCVSIYTRYKTRDWSSSHHPIIVIITACTQPSLSDQINNLGRLEQPLPLLYHTYVLYIHTQGRSEWYRAVSIYHFWLQTSSSQSWSRDSKLIVWLIDGCVSCFCVVVESNNSSLTHSLIHIIITFIHSFIFPSLILIPYLFLSHTLSSSSSLSPPRPQNTHTHTSHSYSHGRAWATLLSLLFPSRNTPVYAIPSEEFLIVSGLVTVTNHRQLDLTWSGVWDFHYSTITFRSTAVP